MGKLLAGIAVLLFSSLFANEAYVVGSWVYRPEAGASTPSAEPICLTLDTDGAFSLSGKKATNRGRRGIRIGGSYEIRGSIMVLRKEGDPEGSVELKLRIQVDNGDLLLTELRDGKESPAIRFHRTPWCSGVID